MDLGPDIISSSFTHAIPLENVSICLQTHSHSDHFDPELIVCRNPEYGGAPKNTLRLLASAKTLQSIDDTIHQHCDYGTIFGENGLAAYSVGVQAVEPLSTVPVDDYKITALPSSHGIGQGCLIYAIEHKEIAILYATDTSTLYDTVWDSLIEKQISFDIVILDHTYGVGFSSKSGDHLAQIDFIDHIRRLREKKLLKTNGSVYATHISHEGNMEHNALSDLAEKHGYSIAYDGLHLQLT